MKISKVDHTKMAVSVSKYKGGKVGGVLYTDPSKKDARNTKNLLNVYEKQNRQAIKLYSIFNMKTNIYMDKEKNKVVSQLMKNFSRNFNSKAFENYTNDFRKEIEDVTLIEQNLQFRSCKVFDKNQSSEDLAEVIVNTALRKSLNRKVSIEMNGERKEYALSKIAIKLLDAVNIQGSKNAFHKIPKDEVLVFVNYVRKDIYGETRTNKFDKTRKQCVIESIEKQNVKVQVFDDEDGKKMLMLSNAEHKRKHYIADFIKEYANANAEEQKKMVRRMRSLIVLYVYGQTEYEESKERTDAPWGKMFTFGDGVFSGVDMQLFEQLEQLQLEQKEIISKKNEDAQGYNNKASKTYKQSSNNKIREIRQQQKKLHNAIQEQISDAISLHYREAVKADGISKEDEFWLQYFEGCVEQLASYARKRNMEHFNSQYLSEYLWKTWFAFIAMKYVDIGKGVYNFVSPNLKKARGAKEIEIGHVKAEFKDGISSFHYERIKAEESLHRNIAICAAFSASVFAKAVVKDSYRMRSRKEDVLQYGCEEGLTKGKSLSEKAFYENPKRRILQYFGGASNWGELSGTGEGEIVQACIHHIGVIRNMSFHYSTSSIKEVKPEIYDLGRKIFDVDYGRLSAFVGEKYCSNNVPMFYKVENIYELIKNLYSDNKERDALIPSFNRLIKKSSLQTEVIDGRIAANSKSKIYADVEFAEKYKSSLYFVLKEIYYNDFLQADDILEYFQKAMKKVNNNISVDKDDEERRAFANFIGRVQGILENVLFKNRVDIQKRTGKKKAWKEKDASQKEGALMPRSQGAISFGLLCQQIMTDFNMQNQGRKNILSHREKTRDSGKNAVTYSHFPLLLYKCLREAFLDFVDKKYGFLREPVCKEKYFDEHTVEEFVCKMPKIEKYAYLQGIIKQSDRAVDWYIMAHFVPAKQLNLLAGDIRCYKQYLLKIDERAESIGDAKGSGTVEKIRHYDNILSVVEFVLMYSGRISQDVNDYFNGWDDYASYLAKYVDFGGSDLASLHSFCNTKCKDCKSTDHSVGIYVDGMGNPILNKNIVYSLLFGNEHKIAGCMRKVTLSEIEEYFSLEVKLDKVFKRGICESKQEQEELKRFQNLKNRIELLDVMTYSEMLNDIMGQMVSWAYLRERDLLYFQLGFHYTRLYYGDAVPKKHKYRQLKGELINITDGAILYQIIAMYNHELKVFRVSEAGEALPAENQGSAGGSIKGFVTEYCQESMATAETYNMGLRFFEDLDRHDEFAAFRNDIAHMKYMILDDRSLWDIFSVFYNGFFVYDTKLKKSVSYICKNILERYFVVANLEMTHGFGKDVPLLHLSPKGLQSDQFTYKIKGGKQVSVNARSDIFLEQLQRLLEYKK